MSRAAKVLLALMLLIIAGIALMAAMASGMSPALVGGIFLAVVVAVVVLVRKIPGPREPGGDVPVRVEGASEPTFNLVRSDVRGGEVWRLVLGREEFTLIRPDGVVTTSLPRAWALMAIDRPGRTRGSRIGVATEAWIPPVAERWLSPEALVRAARSIRQIDDQDVPCYWFESPQELLREVDRYIEETPSEVGAEAAAPLRVQGRWGILGGLIGLVAGIGLLAYGLSVSPRAGMAPGELDPRIKTIVLGAVIGLIGLFRLGKGVQAERQARRLS